jgi:hypothetical protein
MSNLNQDLKIPADLKIPGHRILRELGRGGMASVYLALQESMDREVALKVMSPALGASDASFSERFIREAKIVAKLSHPHIIAVYDVGIAGPYHYFSMEYHTGGDLKARIHDGMMPKMALSITRQVASALAFAHSKGYVHRDVKPENVMFRHDGTALLTDFGIAKADDKANRMTATGAVIGTPHYMSPEQAQGFELDHRADIYSLGVMFYEMLMGMVPYAGTSALSIGIKHLKEPVPQFPPPLHVYQPLLEKLLAKNADERFQSGEEVIAAIDAMSSGTFSQTGLSGAQTVIRGQGTALQATVMSTQVSGQQAKTQASGQHAKTQITGAPAQAASRRGLTMVAAVLVPTIVVGGYFFLRTSVTPVQAPATSIPTSTVDDGKANKLALLLTEADMAALAGRYLDPYDQSAVHKYRQVLDIEPKNARALSGLREITKRYLEKTEQAIDKKDYSQAESMLKLAEQVEPENPAISPIRKAMHEARAKAGAIITTKKEPERKPETKTISPPKTVASIAPAPAPTPKPADPALEREQRLSSFISRINEMIAPAGLTSTRAGLAGELYAEAAKLSPNDARVKNAATQIADAYLKLATARADSKDYSDADGLVRKGLEFAPGHRLLTALQKDITDRQKPKRQTFGGF